jgi:hypothetical protein
MNENGILLSSLVLEESIQWNASISSNFRASVSAKYFVCFLKITNSTSRIAVIVRNPVSKSTFCLNLTNTAFVAQAVGSQCVTSSGEFRVDKFSVIYVRCLGKGALHVHWRCSLFPFSKHRIWTFPLDKASFSVAFCFLILMFIVDIVLISNRRNDDVFIVHCLL